MIIMYYYELLCKYKIKVHYFTIFAVEVFCKKLYHQ